MRHLLSHLTITVEWPSCFSLHSHHRITRKTVCPPCGPNGKWTTPAVCTATTGGVTCNEKPFILCDSLPRGDFITHYFLHLSTNHPSHSSVFVGCPAPHSAPSCLYVGKWRVCEMWNPEYVSWMSHACFAFKICGVMSPCTLRFGWGGLGPEMLTVNSHWLMASHGFINL